jgi:hypothetical protein
LGREFLANPPADIWMPLKADTASTDQSNYMLVSARMKKGVSLQQAVAQMGIAADRYREKYPGTLGPGVTFTAQRWRTRSSLMPRPPF